MYLRVNKLREITTAVSDGQGAPFFQQKSSKVGGLCKGLDIVSSSLPISQVQNGKKKKKQKN